MKTKDLDVLCDPMKKLINDAISKGYELINIELIDYHFNDYGVKMKRKSDSKDILVAEIEGIKYDETAGNYFCECHWSYLEYN